MAQLSRHDEVQVPIAPLIDIVFLLIIFFVVTASMQKDALDREIKLAKARDLPIPTEQDKRTIFINLRDQGPGKPPRVSMGGSEVSDRYILYQLKLARNRHGNEVPVVIRASKSLEWRYIDRINAIIRESGLRRVRHSAEAVK